jgi:hypothetical protein
MKEFKESCLTKAASARASADLLMEDAYLQVAADIEEMRATEWWLGFSGGELTI